MNEEELKEWVKQKLDEGVSEERIRNSLENTGNDPSLVDEVKNPFEKDDVEPVEDEEFEKSGEKDQNYLNVGSSDGEKGRKESFEPEKYSKAGKTEETSQDDNKFPRVNFPQISRPNLLKKFALVGLLSILLAGGLFFTFTQSNTNVVDQVSSLSTNSGNNEGSQISKKGRKCPDVGVRINSVKSINGGTEAEVLVTRGRTEVVLEILRNGEVIGSVQKVVGGVEKITVDAVGDEAVFHPSGCPSKSDSAKIT